MRTLRRVLFVTHNVPRAPGDAAGSFVLRLAVALQASGIQVDILAPGAPGLADTMTLDGVRITRVPYARPSRMTLAYEGTMAEAVRRSWGARWALIGLLLALRRSTRDALQRASREGAPYQALHVHWWFPSGLALWKLRAARGLHRVVTMHGSDVRLAAGIRPAHPVLRAVLHDMTHRAVVSTWMASVVSRLAPGIPVHVAPMPVDLARFAPPPEEAARQGILLVGRLNAQKGIADLLRAAVHPALREVPITIVGDGPDGDALRELARSLDVADRVRWIPAVPHGELSTYYRQAAVVGMPSRGEGLGLVAVEAQACGTPVVGYAEGGLLDVVQTGDRQGHLVPAGDVKALGEALASVLRAPMAVDRASLRAAMMERFAPAQVAADYAAMYDTGGRAS